MSHFASLQAERPLVFEAAGKAEASALGDAGYVERLKLHFQHVSQLIGRRSR